MQQVRVPGFAPSTNGLRFTNSFPAAPFWRFGLRNLLKVELGDVSNGLCGGMTFVVADRFAAGQPRPDDASAPAEDSPLRREIMRRQVDSFEFGRLPITFYSMMAPLRPARETSWAQTLGRVGIDLHSRTWRMVAREWPAIRAQLDNGRLVPLGLVRARSANPFDLTHNHQVLAWGYDLDGSALTLRIYDPNWPGDDTVTIALDVSDPMGGAAPLYSKADGPLVAFFRAPWRQPNA